MASSFTKSAKVVILLALIGISLVPAHSATGTVPVTLRCSEEVSQVPQLYFTDAAYQVFTVELTGAVPGREFQGQLVVQPSMAAGYGTFALANNSLVDLAGNAGSTITGGGTLYVEPAVEDTATPTNTPTDTPTNTPTSTPTNTPTLTPTPTPTDVPVESPTATATPDGFYVSETHTWKNSTQVIFSIPLHVSPPDAEAIFSEALGTHDRSEWRVLTYDPQEERYLEYGFDASFPGIQPGRAYWLALSDKQQVSVSLLGLLEEQDQEIQMSLQKGYNQFGSCYLYPVAFDSIQVEKDGQRLSVLDAARNGWIANQLWYVDPLSDDYRYDVAGFGNVGTIEPWEGYWLYAKEEVTLIIPPLPYQAADKKTYQVAYASSSMTMQADSEIIEAKASATFLTGQGDLIDQDGEIVDTCSLGWDIARSMIRWQNGFLVLDGMGGLHPMGDADLVAGSLDLGFDIARRIVSTGDGYIVLDGFGNLYPGGNAPHLPTPVKFDSDLACDLELVKLASGSAMVDLGNPTGSLPTVPAPPGSVKAKDRWG